MSAPHAAPPSAPPPQPSRQPAPPAMLPSEIPPPDGGGRTQGRWRARWRRVEAFFKVVARGSLTAGERLPPGVRGVAGVSLMIGGVLGFLPVLGFWMFPAGLALLSLDVPPLRRRLDRWLGVRPPDDTP